MNDMAAVSAAAAVYDPDCPCNYC